jgi:hypothetical protein
MVVAVTVMVKRLFAEGITYFTTLKMAQVSLEGNGQLHLVEIILSFQTSTACRSAVHLSVIVFMINACLGL